MCLKYLLLCAELKDLHVHFGASHTSFSRCTNIGIPILVKVLISNPKAKVFWDQSPEGLETEAERTKAFLDIPNVVGFIDGDKLCSLEPSDLYLQNRDYNGWTKECTRNIVLLWNTHGQIVDCVVNLPGNFHDLKSTKWGGMYNHIGKLPVPYKVCCDDAFYTKDFLEGKLVKTKERYIEGEQNVRDGYDQSLTHLRQASEWGNNVLVGTFWRLKKKLPTDNKKRAYLMWACILLCNWRTETVSRNQIRTYFSKIQMESTKE